MNLTGGDGRGKLTLMHSESFSIQGSFIGRSNNLGDPNDSADNRNDLKSQLRELCADPLLKRNLIGSCSVWLISSFNFYLITFYLKYFPGNVYVNSLCFAFADVLAFLGSGLLMKYYTVSQSLCLSYSMSLIGGLLYLILYSTDITWVVPVVVTFSRIGGQMSFNIGYVSVARLFPTKFVASAFGIVNFAAHLVTVAAPIVSELPNPIPFVVFCVNSFVAIFAAFQLVEIDRAQKIKKNVQKLVQAKE